MGISRGRSMACELHTSLHNFMRLFSFPCVGNAGLPPLNLYARVPLSMCTLHTRPRVQRAPGIPCSLCSFEGHGQGNSGKPCREIANVYLEHGAGASFETREDALLTMRCERQAAKS